MGEETHPYGAALKEIVDTLGYYVGRSDMAVPYQSSLACAGPSPNTSRNHACNGKIPDGFYTADVSGGHHINISHDEHLQRYRTSSGYNLWVDLLDSGTYASMTVDEDLASNIPRRVRKRRAGREWQYGRWLLRRRRGQQAAIVHD